MPPRKTKRQPPTPAFISYSSADEDYIDSEISLETDSDVSKASGEEMPSDTVLTPSKPLTRLRVMDPPTTPSPKKTPSRGTKRSLKEEKETMSISQESSPTKKQRIKEITIIRDASIDSMEEQPKDKKGKGKSTVQAVGETVYLEDLDPETKIPALKKCGVFDKDLVDDLLKYTYSKLPKLPGGKRLIGWTNPSYQHTVEGFAYFSTIKEIFPDADMSYLKGLICFDGDKAKNVVNLSRADPASLCLKALGGLGSSYLCYRGSMVPARCLILGLIHEDRTRDAYQLSTGKWMKSLSLIPFCLEADRMIAAIAVIYETESFHGQIANGNILSFATRQGLLDNKGSPGASSPKIRRGRFAKPTSSVGVSSQSTTLGVRSPEDDIPILDARTKKLKLPDNVKDIVDTFPRFSRSIPKDSLVLACYTTSKYQKNSDIYASFNIQWAAVLCTEADTLLE